MKISKNWVNSGNFVGRYSTVSVLSCFFQKSLVESGYFVKWDLVTKALYILDSNWRIKQQFLLPSIPYYY